MKKLEINFDLSGRIYCCLAVSNLLIFSILCLDIYIIINIYVFYNGYINFKSFNNNGDIGEVTEVEVFFI